MNGWAWVGIGIVISAVAGLPAKWAQGYTYMGLGILALVLYLISHICWGMALRTLPLGISYVIWTGLGAVLAFATGILFFQERLTATTLIYALLVLAGCIGLCLHRETA